MRRLLLGDCIELMQDMEDESVDAVIADPPYNIGKASWDKIDNYLAWCERWIAEAQRVCKQQGAFWCFHREPFVLTDIGRIIEQHDRPQKNWITWDKFNEHGHHYMKGYLKGYTVMEDNRSFRQMAEYIVYHADDGQWQDQSDKCRGFIFEPLRRYIVDEFERAGMMNTEGKIAANVACGFSPSSGGMASRHYFSRSQWQLPTREHYEALRNLLNSKANGEYLRREYEDLRREYEYLRPTFNNPGYVSSVWQFPPAKSEGHPTTKPVPLLSRIVKATTDAGDTVLDPFMGSGTTGVAAVLQGRHFVGMEKKEKYYKIAERRIKEAKNEMRLFNFAEAGT